MYLSLSYTTLFVCFYCAEVVYSQDASRTILNASRTGLPSSDVVGSITIPTTLTSVSNIETSSIFSLTSSASSIIITAAPTSTASSNPSIAPFPPVGSIPRDYTPAGLSRLWDLIGPVEIPPITTTVIPQTPIALPSPPPALYPPFFAVTPKDILPDLKFPKGFLFGVASAAYQVEGAVKDEGKGPSVWDCFLRALDKLLTRYFLTILPADVVDLHYYLYKEDVARIAALGINSHSFSISWARIFPFGAADSPVNQEGIDHYADVIATHLKSNVTPVVTLFHWDPPLALSAYYGGFASPNIVDDFIHYAKTVFTAYNGSVHTWYTFNEPQVFCSELGSFPFNLTLPNGVNSSNAQFQCSYYLLKAHAGAVKAFREMHITGEIAFKSADYVGMPWRTNNTEDVDAVERHAAFGIGIFADPVYTTGDWPQILKDTLPPDYLPRFTEEESKEILGESDFFAIDAYRTYWNTAPPEGIGACVKNLSDPLWPSCNLEVMVDLNGWASGPASDPLTPWLQATPQFLRTSFKEYHRRWPAPKIYFSEFGFTQPFEGLRTPAELSQITEDPERTNYYMTYLGELLLSIHEDGIPVEGAFAWAIMDNAEWNSGLSARFGIQYVNYSSPNLERSYKRSAFALCKFMAFSETLQALKNSSRLFQQHLQN
ncbi:glycoside hydrolase superfamily [Lentinula guzmanii]|uniref:Glycoside hydrolase superfamily n=1 Tax=Lentinula guzmanii TaxID=2804957 RepID=A0AA38N1L6_9AGAR|nr:glycoside hydrolase superfamily [Lentinula guzmanii]